MKKHYLDLKDMPFYAGLCKYMSSGPIFAMVTLTQTHVNTRKHTHSQVTPVTYLSVFISSHLLAFKASAAFVAVTTEISFTGRGGRRGHFD